jgi:maleylpyruvate isomerase
MMQLYSYWRSSASYRVRIALALKGIAYDYHAVNLAAGAQRSAAFQALSGNGLVPLLLVDGQAFHQSLAIIEYLDESYPSPALLPSQPVARAGARALAQSIACDTHPLNNLRVLTYLESTLGADSIAKMAWYHHWTRLGLQTVEHQLQRFAKQHSGAFAFGHTPGLVECVLVPQIFNARRFKVSIEGLPRIGEIELACQRLSSFMIAAPENCPDCP